MKLVLNNDFLPTSIVIKLYLSKKSANITDNPELRKATFQLKPLILKNEQQRKK
ncbi:hypothetical protein O5404_05165 (plasmid) [Borrelia miyamotoi]|uniref:Uncharacterized protein n=1 Tax=Borrelia miyamotoi TaxID=47466 RepID=A0AAX3JP02_9SPIR|nr:hypothetical protein [Borrelia miyamotoi]WAZ72414.1 hypothetical protein O5404_05165 [Borrelia miyamotoi]WVI05336.1 hypothetical protein F9Y91_00525 [Borrelia miyamotoi]